MLVKGAAVRVVVLHFSKGMRRVRYSPYLRKKLRDAGKTTVRGVDGKVLWGEEEADRWQQVSPFVLRQMTMRGSRALGDITLDVSVEFLVKGGAVLRAALEAKQGGTDEQRARVGGMLEALLGCSFHAQYAADLDMLGNLRDMAGEFGAAEPAGPAPCPGVVPAHVLKFHFGAFPSCAGTELPNWQRVALLFAWLQQKDRHNGVLLEFVHRELGPANRWYNDAGELLVRGKGSVEGCLLERVAMSCGHDQAAAVKLTGMLVNGDAGGGWKVQDTDLTDMRGVLAGARVRLVSGPLVDFIDEILAGLGRLADIRG